MGGQTSKQPSTQLSTTPYSSSRSKSLSVSQSPLGSHHQCQQEGSLVLKRPSLQVYAKSSQKTLPTDFSQKLIDCEMELEKEEISFASITKLIDIYMQAMSYYEAKSCAKYKYFEKKLQELMIMPKVEEAIMKETRGELPEEDKEVRRIRFKSLASQANPEKEAFVLVKSYENAEREIIKVLEGDLSSQKTKLKRRITERKSRSPSLNQSIVIDTEENPKFEGNVFILENEADNDDGKSETLRKNKSELVTSNTNESKEFEEKLYDRRFSGNLESSMPLEDRRQEITHGDAFRTSQNEGECSVEC